LKEKDDNEHKAEPMVGNLSKLADAVNRAADSRKQNLFVERRAEKRLWCSDLVHVWWKDSARWKKKGLAVLEDISPSGACVQLELPLPCGARVRIKHQEWKVEGEVRYCMYRDEGYFLGVRLDDDARWSESAFKPKHMIDPTRVPPRKKDPG
jgi:hypothetical protein